LAGPPQRPFPVRTMISLGTIYPAVYAVPSRTQIRYQRWELGRPVCDTTSTSAPRSRRRSNSYRGTLKDAVVENPNGAEYTREPSLLITLIRGSDQSPCLGRTRISSISRQRRPTQPDLSRSRT